MKRGDIRLAQSKLAQGHAAYLEVTLVGLKEPQEGELGIRDAGHENLLNPEMDMDSLVSQFWRLEAPIQSVAWSQSQGDWLPEDALEENLFLVSWLPVAASIPWLVVPSPLSLTPSFPLC